MTDLSPSPKKIGTNSHSTKEKMGANSYSTTDKMGTNSHSSTVKMCTNSHSTTDKMGTNSHSTAGATYQADDTDSSSQNFEEDLAHIPGGNLNPKP